MGRQRHLRFLSVLVAAALLLAVVGGGQALAQGTPPAPVLPQSFWGSVKDANGNPILSGTVEVWFNGVKQDSIAIVNGQYGGPGGLEDRLMVQGSAEDIGKTIEFYVNGVKAKETAKYQPGEKTRLDLTAAIPADTIPPTVESTDPGNGATNVPVGKTVTVTFSEDVQAGTAYDGISVKDASGNDVSVTKSIDGKMLTIRPGANLAYATKYTVTIPAGAVKDLAGNALAQGYSFSFTMQAAPAPAPSPAPAPGPTPAPAPAVDKVEKAVQAGATTVAELPGRVKVEVPAGAVTGADARLLLTVLQESESAPILNQAEGIQPASPVVDVSVKDGQVSGSVTVVLSYDPAKVPAGRVPAAYFYSDKKACWVYLGGKVDPDRKAVSVEVSHLTKFAVFARDPVPALTDMQGHWAEQVVARLAGMGVVSGYPGNVFKPGAEISRAECAAILVRALGLPTAGEDELGRFKDAADIPSWARGLVAAAVKEGLVKGYPEQDGAVTFRAGNPVTRGELAVLVARIMAKEVGPVTGTVSQFADASKIPDWAKESVGAAAAKGIIKGYEDGTFRAANNVTRSEAAAMILRLLDLVYTP